MFNMFIIKTNCRIVQRNRTHFKILKYMSSVNTVATLAHPVILGQFWKKDICTCIFKELFIKNTVHFSAVKKDYLMSCVNAI